MKKNEKGKRKRKTKTNKPPFSFTLRFFLLVLIKMCLLFFPKFFFVYGLLCIENQQNHIYIYMFGLFYATLFNIIQAFNTTTNTTDNNIIVTNNDVCVRCISTQYVYYYY